MTTGMIVHELLKMPFEFSQVKFDVLWQSIKSHSISNNIKNIDYLQSIADFIKDKYQVVKYGILKVYLMQNILEKNILDL